MAIEALVETREIAAPLAALILDRVPVEEERLMIIQSLNRNGTHSFGIFRTNDEKLETAIIIGHRQHPMIRVKAHKWQSFTPRLVADVELAAGELVESTARCGRGFVLNLANGRGFFTTKKPRLVIQEGGRQQLSEALDARWIDLPVVQHQECGRPVLNEFYETFCIFAECLLTGPCQDIKAEGTECLYAGHYLVGEKMRFETVSFIFDE